MIFWIIIFIIVIFISLILAVLSMKDYSKIQKIPNIEYGLFLIRRTSHLSLEILNNIWTDLENDLVSFEKLFKGEESALLIYGPKDLLKSFYFELNLLELEDYIPKDEDSLYFWEFGLKGDLSRLENLYEKLPTLSKTEQFWLQIVLGSIHQRNVFRGEIRAVVYSQDSLSSAKLVHFLRNLSPSYLIRLPKAYSNKQILDSYKSRSLGLKETKTVLNPQQILKLLQV